MVNALAHLNVHAGDATFPLSKQIQAVAASDSLRIVKPLRS
jgi:hypothetical protein